MLPFIDADLKNIFRKASPAVDVDADENIPVPIPNGVRTVTPGELPAPTIGDKCNIVRMVAELGPIRLNEIEAEISVLDKKRNTLSQEAETLGWLIAALHNGKEAV